MKIFAIGDLHFSGDPPTKPMHVFGENWRNHREKILASWNAKVQPEDLVIICGDISWALHLKDALSDLDALAALPGHKLLLRGNHDYWWSTVRKMTVTTKGAFSFLHNSFYPFGNIAICGTRGWDLPEKEGFTPKDELIYQREALRFEHSLRQAQAAGYREILAVLHYPPLYTAGSASLFSSLCTAYAVQLCIFGHIHGPDSANIFQGSHNNTVYRLVAADYLNFELAELISCD